MRKTIFVFFFICSTIFAQNISTDSSFIDEIDLTLGAEFGIVKTIHYVDQLKDFTYLGSPVDQNIPFGFAPIFTLQAGLRGFGFDLFAFVRNSFLNYGADGKVYIKDGVEIFPMHQELFELGLGLYYDIHPRWHAGLIYSIYSVEARGQQEGGEGNSMLSLNFYFKQLKGYAAYDLKVKEDFIIPVSALFTIYSTIEDDEHVLIEFEDQYAPRHLQYMYKFGGKPFNFATEIGFRFNFALVPFVRYEYLSIGSSYHFHLFSLKLHWAIPYQN